MNPKLKSLLFSKPFKIIAALLVTYLLFAYFAVNPLAKRILPWVAENKLASKMTVGQVKFDPLRLIVRVDNLRLTTPNGDALAGFEHLYVNAETSGIFHFAWRLKDIRLTEPQVAFDIDPQGKLNWAALIAKLNEDKQPSSGMPRVMIDHILIEGGNIAYTGRNRPSPFKLALKPLGLELEGLSTLPEDRGDYLISAKLPEQSGTLKWKGDLGLNPIASNGTVDLSGINIAKLLQVVEQSAMPVKITAGELQTGFSYNFAMTKGAEPKPEAQLSNLAIKLSHLAGNLNSHASLALDEATVKLPKLEFSMGKGTQVRFAGLGFAAKQLALTEGKDAVFKLEQANVKGVDFDLAANQLKIADIVLNNGVVNGSRAKDGSINLLALAPETKVEAEATVVKPGEKVADTGKPFAFEIANVQLQHWKAAFADASFNHPLNAQIKDINLGLNVNNTNGITINNAGLELNQISLQSALSPQPLASLDKVALKDGSIKLKDSTVKLASIVLSGLQTQVLREADKSLNWQTALAQPAVANAAPAKQAASNPWKVALDKLALENSSVHIEDKATTKPMVLDLQNLALELQKPTLDLSKQLPVKAKFAVKQGGQFDASGKLAISPFKTDLQFKLAALSLKPFTAYVNQAAYLDLDEGQASIYGKLALSGGQTLNGDFAGGFSVNDLAISEENSTEPFVAWKEISSDSLKYGFASNQLHMDALNIVQLVGKFIIHEDKTVNVQRIMRPQPASAAQPVAKAVRGPEFGVAIDRVSLQNADMQFTDLSLKPQFGTHMNSLSGVINGLSSNPASTAQVELDGKVDEFGSAKIRGSVQPFHATDFTDLKLAFHNLEMKNLTPYSGKFAGRKIDSGKISVDLEYKIKNRQMAGENKFVINQLKLGERVDSPDAANLPLDLAIALLEDKDGLIDLDLPISGSLDDPQFSYGKIIWKAVVNVLGKIVTSPFRALGKLMGLSSDKLDAIVFDPGKATLAPEEQEKVKAMGSAMSKRPSLLLTISPTTDDAADLAALQEQATRRDVLKEMGINLKDGEQLGPIDINNPKAQTAIELLLKERQGAGSGSKALTKLKGLFKKSTPEDSPKYADMLEQLTLRANVSEADVAALAKSRASNLQSYLVEQAGVEADKVNIGSATKVQANEKGIAIKLDLSAKR
ncbi:MAG TPA: DUF748 domain-containing protein [Methylophilaceae bacterium]